MIIIARFSFPHEAHIAKASLEAAGIKSYIADEHTVNAQWLYSNALGGVRLLVSENDAEEACQLLNSDFSQSVENEADIISDVTTTCPFCGSNDLSPYTKGKRPAFLVFLLLGFPLFFLKHGYKCNHCGKFSEKY